MSHSPSPYTAVRSTFKLDYTLVGSSPPAGIKREEVDIESSIPLFPLVISRSTPIPASTPPSTTPAVDPTTSTSVPTFTPICVSIARPRLPPTSASSPTPTHTPITPTPIPTSRRPGRQGRPPKERILTKNKPVETVNYPCYEQLSNFHRQRLQELNVYPLDGVSKYTRSIPFKGAKESFLKRTGRNRFDVYEYRFTAPNVKGEDKYWWVMWDYYNGLVRVHDFFDCCKPGKTEPGNAVKEKINPGLQSVCHNITGGNLHAQGYWIPYPAAKALATKFCFRIRFALTIIFGDDFPSQCLPETHPEFGKYAIDPEIIKACQQTSAQQYAIEQQRTIAVSPHLGPSTPSNSSSRLSTVASNSSASTASTVSSASPIFQVHQVGSCRPLRISVTPDKTPQTPYFDPVRDGYTNGSSSNSNIRQPQPQQTYSTAPVTAPTMAKKSAKYIKPRRVDNVDAGDSSPPTAGSAPQRKSVSSSIKLPPMGNFSPVQGLIRRCPQPTGSAAPRKTVKAGIQGMNSRPLIRGTSTRNSSYSPPTGRAKGKSTSKQPNPRTVSSSYSSSSSSVPEPRATPHLLPPLEIHDPETPYRQPPNKKPKLAPSEPRVFTNPYMNPIRFNVGTFQCSSRTSSRDSSIPEPENPYTRKCYDALVAMQVEETPEDLLAAEAAGNLMELQRRDYDRDFAQRKEGQSSSLKRWRSS